MTNDNKIVEVSQEFSRIRKSFSQDPTPSSLSVKTKQYQVNSATVAATEISFT